MCNYVLFWISYLLSALQWIWILKRFFVTHGLGPGKPGPRAAKPIIPPYVENNYRIEVKITFMLIAYLVLLCEFIWEFSIFHSCRPLVDIYWHPLLSRRFLNQNYPKYTSNVVSKILEKIKHNYQMFCQNLRSSWNWASCGESSKSLYVSPNQFWRIFSMLLNSHSTIKWRWKKFCCN